MRVKRLSVLSTERLVRHNLVVGAGTVSAGVLGFVFQAVISHRLRPEDYGGAFAVLTLLLFIGLPAGAATLVMARETSRDRAESRWDRSGALLQAGNRSLLLIGVGIGAFIALTSPWLGRFLNVGPEVLVAGAAGIPFVLAFPLLLGQLQGAQRFSAMSLVTTGQAALKLAGAVILGAFFGSVGVLAGVSLGSALVYLLTLAAINASVGPPAAEVEWRRVFGFFAVVLPSTLALAVLFSTDVILVKHFFGVRPAGQYAAVAALGRAIFWGASAVAGVLFPKVIFREAKGGSGYHLVAASVFLAALGGTFALGIFSAWSLPILTLFAGSAYSAATTYLPWYALGMTLFGSAAVLIAAHQSRGEAQFLFVLLPITGIEPVAIIAFHASLLQVVQVVDACMAILFIGVAALFLSRERGRVRRSVERVLVVEPVRASM